MLSLILLVAFTNPAPKPATKPAPAPVIVNVATVEYQDNTGKKHQSVSNEVTTKIVLRDCR